MSRVSYLTNANLMEQDRWVEESKANRQKPVKTIIALGVLVAAIIGIAFFSCGEKKVKSLSLDKGQATLKVDETNMLYETTEPKDIHPILLWRSSDERIATVMNGLVTGRKAGKVMITVTVKDQEEISASCEYVVEDPILDVDMETLDILEEPLVLRPGGHQQMKVSVTPENQTETILWSSTNESVARVNPRGKVEAIKIGYAYIIAVSDRTGVRDSALVSVEGAGAMPDMASGQTTATPASPAATTAPKPAPKTVTKTPVKTSPMQPAKPVTKASASGTKSLGYANFRGSWPSDVNGRMEFTKTHVIDSKDPKGRMASPGDYVIGEWSDGHLVQGIWYGSDNQVKGSILIGK